jgi:hypothetical protein
VAGQAFMNNVLMMKIGLSLADKNGCLRVSEHLSSAQLFGFLAESLWFSQHT